MSHGGPSAIEDDEVISVNSELFIKRVIVGVAPPLR